jgi:hypothetical protein
VAGAPAAPACKPPVASSSGPGVAQLPSSWVLSRCRYSPNGPAAPFCLDPIYSLNPIDFFNPIPLLTPYVTCLVTIDGYGIGNWIYSTLQPITQSLSGLSTADN